MDTFIKSKCNRRGEAVSGADKVPWLIRAEDSFSLRWKTQAGHCWQEIHKYKEVTLAPNAFAPYGLFINTK
jgi:hypothetical protein